MAQTVPNFTLDPSVKYIKPEQSDWSLWIIAGIVVILLIIFLLLWCSSDDGGLDYLSEKFTIKPV